ncbi:MAG TPA: hypothetical protein VN374_01265 [Desulfitobacteriaceae bacterium]|nr:hypothetical protein [Desulfitobacteriaceae bacterium]
MAPAHKQPKLTLEQASSHELVVRAVKKAISDFACRDLVVKPFAQGGLGVIFTVRNHANQKILLKVPSYGRRNPDEYWLLEHSLAKEANILRELNCEAVPGLIKFDDSGKYLFREFAAGQRLEDLHKKGAVTDVCKKNVLSSLLLVARQLFDTFHLHAKGCFVIRDFKPVNLILSEHDSSIKLVDVGGTRPENDMLSKTARPFRVGSGKWLHWAPEQLMEMRESLDRRADYFSLGSTVFFVLVGKPPYGNTEPDRDKVFTLYQEHYWAILCALDNVGKSLHLPPGLVEYIGKCLSPLSKDRPCFLPEWIGSQSI